LSAFANRLDAVLVGEVKRLFHGLHFLHQALKIREVRSRVCTRLDALLCGTGSRFQFSGDARHATRENFSLTHPVCFPRTHAFECGSVWGTD